MLIFTHSTMGGGKSALLISKYYNAKAYAISMKSSVDTRGPSDKITSRNGFEIDAYAINKELDLGQTLDYLTDVMNKHIEKTGNEPKFIFLDEAQFLTREQVDALLMFSLNTDIIIECFGLLTDFQTNLFEGSKRLVELADKIENIPAYSRDGNIAKQNFRTAESEEVVFVGGDDAYRAVSNREYFKGGRG